MFVGAAMARVGGRLADYEVIGAVGVRPSLRALRVDLGSADSPNWVRPRRPSN